MHSLELSASATLDADRHLVTVAGEADAASVAALSNTLSAALDAAIATGGRRVDVDLSDLTFLGCAGVTALLAARSLAEAQQVALCVVGSSDAVRRVLRLAQLDTSFVPEVRTAS